MSLKGAKMKAQDKRDVLLLGLNDKGVVSDLNARLDKKIVAAAKAKGGKENVPMQTDAA